MSRKAGSKPDYSYHNEDEYYINDGILDEDPHNTEYTDWCNQCNNQRLGYIDQSSNLFYCNQCWTAFNSPQQSIQQTQSQQPPEYTKTKSDPGNNINNNNPYNTSKKNNKNNKRLSKNQPISSRASYFQNGTEIKEWQKTPTIILREWCQQHKRDKPRFVNAYINNYDLQFFCKCNNISIEAAKPYRRRVILPSRGHDRSKDLAFCTKELYKTQKHSEHMTSLLALHALCPSLQLGRKLPDTYKNIWLSFKSDKHAVHPISKFKSRKEQIINRNNELANKKIRDRKREQYEYERWGDLNRIHMTDELRIYIQNILREQYMKISQEETHNIGLVDMGVVNVNEIEKQLSGLKGQIGQKINTFLDKMIEGLVALGFKKKDCKKAAYSTAGVEFLKDNNRINEYVVVKSIELLSDGVKVVKQYRLSINDYDINVDKYVCDGVTWLCLHLKDNELPKKYAAYGKQFEISVVNRSALGFDNNNVLDNNKINNENIMDLDKDIYGWLFQFGYPKKIIIEFMNNDISGNKYIILGEIFKKLVYCIGNNELKESLDLIIDDTMLTESDEAIRSELESLPFICEDVLIKQLKISEGNSHADYMWSKKFKCGKYFGILEIYRIVNCKGFNCYPQQIPIITFHSPNNSISFEYCQYILQCLIKQTEDILSNEMSFTLINWIQENIKNVLSDGSNISDKLYTNWEDIKEEKKEFEEIKENKILNEKKEEKKWGKSEIYKLFEIKKEKALRRNVELDIYLLNKYRDKLKYNKQYQQFARIRQALPAYACKNKIIDLILSNQVLVISGETGCGKSTQIPQYILDYYIENNNGSLCNIVCTQPRRISAIGLADRVSNERCEDIGNIIGYSIRLENKCSKNTQILYCTTGILLRRLMSSLKIQSITHVIIDEVHERSVDIDFLLVILKFLIQKRPDLKLILMSATLNSKLFSNYFNNCPVLEIPGRTFPVKEFFLEDLLSESRINLPKCKWSKILHEEERIRYKELKENKIYINFKKKYNDRIFHQLCKWDERDNHKCEIELIVDCIFHIIKTYPLFIDNENKNNNGILIFLPGMYEINKSEKIFWERIKDKQMNENNFWVIPLHSSLPTINQKQIFRRPPHNIRKVVLSTNIAETSITINDIKYVIDSGKMREMSYNPNKNLSILSEIWISRAQSLQRQGRAGRVGPGYCYKLYTKYKYLNKMIESPIPELLRSSLENVSLKIKLLRQLSLFKNKKDNKLNKKGDINGIKTILLSCIEPPCLELIESSIFGLKTIGALNEKELLTPLGYHLSKLPVSNIRLGKMLIYGSIFKCLTPCLIISAILTTGKRIYHTYSNKNINKMDILNQIKTKYYNLSLKSDHITMYKFYCEWKKHLLYYSYSGAKKFAYDNCLSHIVMEQVDGIIKQYKSALKEIGFIDKTYNFNQNIIKMDHFLDTNSKSYKLIKSMLVGGLYPNIIKIKLPKKKYDKTLNGQIEKNISDAKSIKYYIRSNDRIFIHPQSNLFKEINFECKWLIYLTKIYSRNKLQVYDLSMITPYSLLFFGNNINVIHNKQHIIIDNWIRFIAPSQIAVLVKELKKMCDYLLIKKITNPNININNHKVINAIERLLKSDGLEHISS